LPLNGDARTAALTGAMLRCCVVALLALALAQLTAAVAKPAPAAVTGALWEGKRADRACAGIEPPHA